MTFLDTQTALKLINASVSQLEGQVESIVNSIPDPIFIIDEEGYYLSAIGGQGNSIHADMNFLKGKNFTDVFSKQLSDTFISAITKAISTGSLVTIEYELDNANTCFDLIEEGCSQWFQGRVFPIKQKISDSNSVVWLAINITEKKRLERKLEKMADVDHLTGAFNRRFFYKIVTKEFSASTRYNSPLSLLIMDIDHFKKINDTYGHDVGDIVLQELVKNCSAMLRGSDNLVRFGGEEFVILMPQTSVDDAFVLAERLRKNIHNNVISAGEEEIQISVSIGLSQVSAVDEDIDSTLKRADLALYDAKNGGRNCVCRN